MQPAVERHATVEQCAASGSNGSDLVQSIARKEHDAVLCRLDLVAYIDQVRTGGWIAAVNAQRPA